ncbi:Lipase lipl-1 [Dirofilaria immitis]
MTIVYLGIFLIITSIHCYLDVPLEAKMTTVEMILHHGYPAQKFHAYTSDGYILELHRIPFGKNNSFTKCRRNRPVFLQHGLLGSSADWVENLPNESFDKCDELFWKFSWDEMAKFDLDAMFNVVLNETKQNSLYYIGYSQGTLIMFAKLSQDSNFSSKIHKFFALAPIGTVAYVKGLLRLFATRLFYSAKMMKQLFGPESNQFNKSRLVVYIAGEGGTSVMNIIHWIQLVNSQKIQAYNYDSVKENRLHYGRDSPPIYNISSIHVPIYLYWSKNDWLASAADIEKSLLSVLPKKSIRGRNVLKDFNHLDFIWGLRASHEIYHPIISIINKENDTGIV